MIFSTEVIAVFFFLLFLAELFSDSSSFFEAIRIPHPHRVLVMNVVQITREAGRAATLLRAWRGITADVVYNHRITLHTTPRRTVNNTDNNTDNSVYRRGDIRVLLSRAYFPFAAAAATGVFFADAAINYATVLCRTGAVVARARPAGRVSARREKIIRAA